MNKPPLGAFPFGKYGVVKGRYTVFDEHGRHACTVCGEFEWMSHMGGKGCNLCNPDDYYYRGNKNRIPLQ